MPNFTGSPVRSWCEKSLVIGGTLVGWIHWIQWWWGVLYIAKGNGLKSKAQLIIQLYTWKYAITTQSIQESQLCVLFYLKACFSLFKLVSEFFRLLLPTPDISPVNLCKMSKRLLAPHLCSSTQLPDAPRLPGSQYSTKWWLLWDSHGQTLFIFLIDK